MFGGHIIVQDQDGQNNNIFFFLFSGTRFRPLSLDIPKPLFPVAGLPMIQHHIEACASVPNLKEILILGYYPSSELSQFIADMVQEYKGLNIRYEYIIFILVFLLVNQNNET
jgi:Nucleoside-diphosphate-sugar pyrophosphorylase involved in lipopolysaccharide biosynthesis/translation initiation factor 2B, gamma/epsilon subunits (eIF-2Bgamma/eIF-2Bepsilon)